jgi:acyl-CoA synthetase (AMP-forming)/AMP-acid ligase II
MFFVDRKKNVIRRSGENIAAVEVESRADAAPGVSRPPRWQPLPDPVRGDEVFACLNVDGECRAQGAGP